MTLLVRDFKPDDAEAVAGLLRLAVPYQITTPQVLTWRVAQAPPVQRYRIFVAELAGELAGVARTGRFFDVSQAFLDLTVHPRRRGVGVGTALLKAAEEHLTRHAVTRVHAEVHDDEASAAFAERHGYRRDRSSHFQRLDLTADLPGAPACPDGTRVGTAVEFADDPGPLYELDAEAAADEPQDVDADATGYAEWLALFWERPDLDRALTSVVIADGRPVAFSLAHTDGGQRYWSGFTGTRRAYRGRGLAKLAKHDSLRRAREAGYTEALTSNDTGNGPMLAVNGWLGYRPCALQWRWLRDLR